MVDIIVRLFMGGGVFGALSLCNNHLPYKHTGGINSYSLLLGLWDQYCYSKPCVLIMFLLLVILLEGI